MYSVEAARYRSAMLCALLAGGKKRTSCGLSLQDLEKERALMFAYEPVLSSSKLDLYSKSYT